MGDLARLLFASALAIALAFGGLTARRIDGAEPASQRVAWSAVERALLQRVDSAFPDSDLVLSKDAAIGYAEWTVRQLGQRSAVVACWYDSGTNDDGHVARLAIVERPESTGAWRVVAISDDAHEQMALSSSFGFRSSVEVKPTATGALYTVARSPHITVIARWRRNGHKIELTHVRDVSPQNPQMPFEVSLDSALITAKLFDPEQVAIHICPVQLLVTQEFLPDSHASFTSRTIKVHNPWFPRVARVLRTHDVDPALDQLSEDHLRLLRSLPKVDPCIIDEVVESPHVVDMVAMYPYLDERVVITVRRVREKWGLSALRKLRSRKDGAR